jgi:hypothetical protein
VELPGLLVARVEEGELNIEDIIRFELTPWADECGLVPEHVFFDPPRLVRAWSHHRSSHSADPARRSLRCSMRLMSRVRAP